MSADYFDTQLLRQRDEVTWNALYSAMCRRTYRLLAQVTRASAAVVEELNQEVWVSAMESVEKLDAQRGSAQDWILGIARFKGLTYLRKQYASRTVCVGSAEDLPEADGTDERTQETAERQARLDAAILFLPEHWRLVLRQKYLLGLSVKRIAELMGSSPKSVESILSRARQRLRDLCREPI